MDGSAHDRAAIVERSAGILDRRVGDTVLLLPVGSGELRRLDGVAAATWLVTHEPISFGDLVDGACAAAGRAIGDAEVVANVGRAVDALQSGGLVVVAPVDGSDL